MWSSQMATLISGSRTRHQPVTFLLEIILSPELIILTSGEIRGPLEPGEILSHGVKVNLDLFFSLMRVSVPI